MVILVIPLVWLSTLIHVPWPTYAAAGSSGWAMFSFAFVSAASSSRAFVASLSFSERRIILDWIVRHTVRFRRDEQIRSDCQRAFNYLMLCFRYNHRLWCLILGRHGHRGSKQSDCFPLGEREMNSQDQCQPKCDTERQSNLKCLITISSVHDGNLTARIDQLSQKCLPF